MSYETVIFDMDGTILETLEDIWDSVNVTMDHLGYPRRSLDEVRQFVGNGAAKLIERCLPAGGQDPNFHAALAFYKVYYDAHAQVRTGPYAGIPELLAQLKRRGVKLAVVSNKPDESVRQLCEAYFPGVFQVTIGDRPQWRKKPAPDSVFEAMRVLEAKPETTVYVGDSEVDVATAKHAGLPCIAVTWGFREAAYLQQQGAGVFAHTTRELLELITHSPYPVVAGDDVCRYFERVSWSLIEEPALCENCVHYIESGSLCTNQEKAKMADQTE